MTMTCQDPHRRLSAPASQAAPTAVLQAPPAPSATTARLHPPRAARVGGSASLAKETASSSTAAGLAVAIPTTPVQVALLAKKKSTWPGAPDVMVSLCDDELRFWHFFPLDETKQDRKRRDPEESIQRSISHAVHSFRLFAMFRIHGASSWFPDAATRSRIRGPAAKGNAGRCSPAPGLIALWLRDFVAYRQDPMHVSAAELAGRRQAWGEKGERGRS